MIMNDLMPLFNHKFLLINTLLFITFFWQLFIITGDLPGANEFLLENIKIKILQKVD